MIEAPLNRTVARCNTCETEFSFREAVNHTKYHPEKHDVELIER